ncbi:MAG: PAS domain S-box protein [Ignavibacteriales bacterium]|nr:PAS domain S-box protein [Ignavibacteriales bacterium]
MKKKSKQRVIKKWHFVVLVSAISTLLIFGGILYYSSEENSISKAKHQEIKAIAELKISQITQWRKERFGDAASATQAPPFIREIEQWFGNRKDLSIKKNILKQFARFQLHFGYEDIFLASPQGEFLLSLNPKEKIFNKVTSSKIREAIKKQQITFTDFYYCTIHKKIHFDIIAPIIDNKNISIGAMLFRIDPNDYLYPLIQKWPIPSKTAETLLLRREGDSVFYLNELRHQKNTALKLRIPLTKKEIPAVQAVLGYKGIWEGKDYRGVRVLSDIQAIPGTPWFMVAKIDKSEIYSELTFRSILISVFTLVLILLSGTGLAWIYYSRQRNIYRELFVKEKELREAHEEFKTTLFSIGDGVMTSDNNGVVKHMNRTAEELTGWSEADAKGKLLEDIFQIVNEETRNKVENPAGRVIREGMIVGLANHTLLISKDGKEIPIADSGAPIRNEQGKIDGVVLVFRDKTEERKAEKLIRYSEANLKRAESVSKTGNWELHLDSKIIIASEGASKIYGLHGVQFDYSAIKEMPLPEYRLILENALRKLIENGEPYNLEFKLKNDAGEIIDIHSIAEFDKENNIIFGVIQDITERKQMEEALRESEEHYREVVNVSPDTIAIHCEGKIVFVNPAAVKLLCTSSPKDLIGKAAMEFVHPDDREVARSRIAEMFKSGKPASLIEERFIKMDGTVIYVEVAGVLTTYQGKIASQVILRDVTDRKRAAEALQKSEEKFRCIASNTPDHIIMQDNNLRYTLVINPQLGLTEADMIGKTDLDLLQKEEAENLIVLKRKVLEKGESIHLETSILNLKNEPEFFEGTYIPKFDSTGKVNGLIGYFRNVTERKKSEEALHESEEKYRALFETAADAVLLVNQLTGNILDVNSATTILYGYTHDEICKMNVMDLSTQPNVTLKAVQTGEAQIPIRYHKNKNGSIFPVEIRNSLFSYNNQKINVGFIRDITGRKQAEESLRESEKRYRELFDNISSGVAIYEVTGNGNDFIFKDCNRAGERIDGNRKEDIIGKSIYQVRKGITEFGILEVFKRVFETGISEHYPAKFYMDEKLHGWYSNFVYRLPSGEIVAVYDEISERKRAEEKITMLAYALKSINECVSITDLEDKLIFVNQSFLETYGYSEEELIGKDIHIVRSSNNPPEIVREILPATIRGGWNGELWNKRKDGSEFPIYLSTTTINDNDGKPLGLIGVAIDITERKRAEEILNVSETRYRRLFEAARDGIVILDAETGKIVDINPFMIEKLGYSKEQFIEKSIWEIGFFKDVIDNEDKFFELQQKHYVRYENLALKASDGKKLYVEFVSNVYFVDHKKVIQCNIRDITERKKAEEMLRHSEENMRYIIKHDPNAMAVYDRELYYIAVSDRYLQDYNVKEEDIIGKHHYEVFPEMPQRWKEVHQRCLSGAIERNDDDYFERSDGSITYNRWECRPWYNSDGSIGGMITYTEVTTERKRAEMEIKKSHEQLEQLYKNLNDIRENERAEISREIHDELGQSLTALKMDLNWTKENTTDKMLIDKKINGMVDIVNETITKVQKISSSLRPGMLDDLGLIPTLEWYCQEFEERTGLPCHLELKEIPDLDPKIILTLFRIFQGGMTNIIRHAKAKGVVIKLYPSSGNIYLNISDDGVGISKEKINSKDSFGLIGMKERLKQFNGSLKIISSKNKGTSLTIRIPNIQ